MIQRFKKLLFISATLLSVYILLNNKIESNINDSILLEKNISIKDGNNFIFNQYLNTEIIRESKNDSIFGLIKIEVEQKSIFKNIMVRNGYPFYVFQNNHLIYKQEKNTYYKGNEIENKEYYYSNSDLWKNQALHQVPLNGEEPLYILIPKNKNKQISDLISSPNIIEKKIENLITTDIPIIKISTHNNSLDTSAYTFVSTKIITNENVKLTLSKMKIRGNTSLSFPKKQFNIIFDEKNKLNDLELKKNVLISSYSDKSLMRNKIAFDLFSLFRNKNIESEYIHLIINDLYEGVYLITEHPEQQFKKHITDSISSDFLVQIDRGPFNGYLLNNKNGYTIEFNNDTELNKKYEEIIDFEQRIIKNLFKNNRDENLTNNEINIDTFIDYIIINELSKNIDAYRLSTYISFINNSINMNIIWDFDLSFGLANYNDGFNHEGFVIESEISEYIPDFWNNLWNSKLIQEKLINRYKELRKDILSDDNLNNYIEELYKKINTSAEKNFERWEIIGQDVWPNKNNFKSYKEEVDYLQNWILKRLNFLDSKWN
ncbi:MAG: hypothetical protein CMP74_00695 [Flavobacteriales bacterium]|nr:hypothetical protein [Flavobacteriales bacterium]|tara:strand:+ start:565 stop:2199 length:1635 start_codon:yes stop_codon:yes gene_type:complete